MGVEDCGRGKNRIMETPFASMQFCPHAFQRIQKCFCSLNIVTNNNFQSNSPHCPRSFLRSLKPGHSDCNQAFSTEVHIVHKRLYSNYEQEQVLEPSLLKVILLGGTQLMASGYVISSVK